MKDITISSKRIKVEIFVWLCCLLMANVLNIYAIIKYNASWFELFTQLHIVLLVSLIIYILLGVVRVIYLFGKSILKKRKS